jgi:hypothetical protein
MINTLPVTTEVGMPSKDVPSWTNDLEVKNIFTNFHFNLTVRAMDISTLVRTNVNNTTSDPLR